MQKKLLTMAVAGALALPAVALAQVTVFGTIDGGIRNQSKIQFAGADESELFATDGLRTTNRWGFRGSEDLGGGLMANFWLESQYSSDTGAGPAGVGIFGRKAVVGLSKGGNSVDIGRDYTVNFKSQGIYDPMSYTYTGLTPTITFNNAGVRSSNMVTAASRFGTGGVRVDYVMGETVGNDVGNRIGFMGDFAFGPLTLTGAFSTADSAVNQSTDTTNLGGAYTLGAFTFRAGWSNTEVENVSESPMWVLGVQYAISPTLSGRVGYYNATLEDAAGNELGKRKLAIVALDYALSKRTTAYVALDRFALSGNQVGSAILGQTLADGATGISAGIAHTF